MVGGCRGGDGGVFDLDRFRARDGDSKGGTSWRGEGYGCEVGTCGLG